MTAGGLNTVSVGLYRLAVIEGTGSVDGGVFCFDAKDPDGQYMSGKIYPDNGKFTLRFTDADWTYIKTGDA